ncbi:MAG: hypothetical protein HYY67_00590 [Thaumarchaeota archaeon]|jgi:uncharacterized protein (DUF58 family)|nr:hypothetical protein [Nitrososphaerota archaeon]
MKRQTILKAWAIFGVYWFVTFAILTFATSAALPVILVAALSLYAGVILAVISVATLLYEIIRPAKKATAEQKPEEAKPMQ